jgi:tetratricopeptide (TPR) repeat protein
MKRWFLWGGMGSSVCLRLITMTVGYTLYYRLGNNRPTVVLSSDMKFWYSPLFILLSVLSPVPSSLRADEANVRHAYELLRDAMYDDDPLPSVELLYGSALEQIKVAGLPHGPDSLWRSRIEYMIARAYQVWGQKAVAAIHFELGQSLAGEAIASGLQSEGWRMKSEHLAQLCLVKNRRFLLANGPSVCRYAGKALALDPNSIASQIIIAEEKIYSPRIFGGDPQAGIELMQHALCMGMADKDDLFNIYSGIGLAYVKLRNYDEACVWFRKALDIYPNNRFVREKYSRIGN